jgi:hypothetical protein
MIRVVKVVLMRYENMPGVLGVVNEDRRPTIDAVGDDISARTAEI